MESLMARTGMGDASDITEGLIPERQLWTEVMVMAVMDWRGDPYEPSVRRNNSSSRMTVFSKKTAPERGWILQPCARNHRRSGYA
jgi:hypothetical protein